MNLAVDPPVSPSTLTGAAPVDTARPRRWARLRAIFAPQPRAYDDGQLEALVADEARRGARVIVPFMLPALYIVYVILGDVMQQPVVRMLMGAQLALTFVRWGILFALSRPVSHGTGRLRARVRGIAFTGSAWLMSLNFGAIYLTASPALDSSQVMTLTMVATAVCALAMLSMAATFWSYVGYIAIHLGAIILLLLAHPDAKLGAKMPLMAVVLLMGLVAISARTNRGLREKIVLSMQLRDSALRDALTGLRNRHYVHELIGEVSAQVAAEWQTGSGRRHISQKRSLALFIIDLDHFKSINDEHGHAAGDLVLKAFAQIAQSVLRAPDIVARWGGEEFLVMVETRDRESVLAIGERLRRKVAAHRAIQPGGATLSVTCSIGACLFPFDEERPDDLTWEETLELADRALYEGKRSGRNRTLWMRPGTAGLSPREALTATRKSLDLAIRDHAVVVAKPADVLESVVSSGNMAVTSGRWRGA